MSTKSPLRERLLSNSPDTMKSSILRESGHGWSSPPSSQATSPLRIAKRDSSTSPIRPTQVARRTSSSFKHVTSNNLVSKSPFKSQIPASIGRPRGPVPGPPPDSPRKAELENERPFALKRDRRQSKTFQAIMHSEPVSKSPFRRPAHAVPSPQPPSSVSPIRSALVSRRLHGPRLSGGAKQQRRKRVTWGKSMEVLEFEPEEDTSIEQQPFVDSDEEEDENLNRLSPDHSLDTQDSPPPPDGDARIDGLVEELMGREAAPPVARDIPTDLDTEDGVPFSPSHHPDTQDDSHEQQQYTPHPAAYLRNEEPRHSDFPFSAPNPTSQDFLTPPSSPSLGHTSHTGQIRDTHLNDSTETDDEETEMDVQMRPPSPSPVGGPRTPLLPRAEVDHRFPITGDNSSTFFSHSPRVYAGGDPFGLPSLQEESLSERDASDGYDSFAKHSETNLSELILGTKVHDQIFQEHQPLEAAFSSPQPPSSHSQKSPSGRPPLPPIPSHVSSPNTRSPSPNGRLRITREDVQRRLMHKRSFGSPTQSPRGSPGPSRETTPFFDPPRESTPFDLPHPSTPIELGAPRLPSPEPDSELGLAVPGHRLKFDFGSKFGRGLGIDGLSDDIDEIEEVHVDMDMKSALDRLMDDIRFVTDDESEQILNPSGIRRAATEPTLLTNNFPSRDVSDESIPPPPPPKEDNNIKSRERMIIERRREARRIEEEQEDLFYGRSPTPAAIPDGRPQRRRSMSTGDVNDKPLEILPSPSQEDTDDAFEESVRKELEGRKKVTERRSNYLIRTHGTIYASSSRDKVKHLSGAGDVDTGKKSWKAVRRPSDMNEYAKQIRELRNGEKRGHGKVFVRVLGIKGMHLPLPSQRTIMNVTLNNGIHYVTTPDVDLDKDAEVGQEFELIEHSKLEFTLTLKVRRDHHIVEQFRALTKPPPRSISTHTTPGLESNFFSSSPKKSKEKADKKQTPLPQPQPQAPHRLPENLARYLRPDGTLARALVTFKDIAPRCDTRIFETAYPLMGQRTETDGGKPSILQVGEIVLQIFRLPPLPGVKPEELPQSLDECVRGVRHANWHKETYWEGVLTQQGGDCSSWRRRQFRVIGSKLVAFNDITKRATATIELKEALSVEDDQEARTMLSPTSGMSTATTRGVDDYDGLYGIERSFRLIFEGGEEIVFFADTDAEKAKWLEVLRALVGHIPHLSVWAEYLWQLQQKAKGSGGLKPPIVTGSSTA
ncbi:hypothetical protein DL96DRAFT_1602130 [Flagelloscypha sp. PMI_526]|nr:hypothetical protein DL96DRAFT_1602130 [Flagelloscypha sp. PMI_526]